MNIIVGLGRSGAGAAKLLNSEGENVLVIEKSAQHDFIEITKELRELGILVEFEKQLNLSTFKPWLKEISSVVISPAIPWDHQTLNELRQLGVNVQGEISLAWERLHHIPWIGITGTNGKTTVTHMLNHVLKSNQIYSEMGGNVGNSAAEIALKLQKPNTISPKSLIMELSSYQIESSPEISPQIGIWTTLTPDHLDRHGSLEKYADIKRHLIEQSSIGIYNADDEYLIKQRQKFKPGIWVSAYDNNQINNQKVDYWINKRGAIVEKGIEIFNSSVLSMPGIHNIRNLLMATAAAREMGLSPEGIEKSFLTFKGISHRLEYLGEFEQMKFFNDSKATNYDSAISGLKSIPRPIIVIAGGEEKQGDYSEWVNQIKKRACGVVLFGSCAARFESILRFSGFKKEINIYKSLSNATKAAIKMGLKENAMSVVLSPASASFDQYKNYEERGNHFKELINLFLTKSSQH